MDSGFPPYIRLAYINNPVTPAGSALYTALDKSGALGLPPINSIYPAAGICISIYVACWSTTHLDGFGFAIHRVSAAVLWLLSVVVLHH